MKKLLFTLLLFPMSFWVVFLPSANAQTVVSGLQSPESVASDGSFIYISNVGYLQNPSTKDGDGFISKIAKTGQVMENRFIKGLDAPKGMAVIKQVLYIADIDKIVGYSLYSKKRVFEVSLEGITNFLNDITVKNDTTILVSATDVGHIYRINLVDKKIKEYAKGIVIQGINGLDYDNTAGVLYINSMGTDKQGNGELGRITLTKGNPLYERLGTDAGYFDGLKYWNNELYYSDWKDAQNGGGNIRKMNVNAQKSGVVSYSGAPISTTPPTNPPSPTPNPKTPTPASNNSNGNLNEKPKTSPTPPPPPPPIISGELVGKGCADFFIDTKLKYIYIPLMLEGKLLIHKLP